jgi:ketosteroid isomerase-like protein
MDGMVHLTEKEVHALNSVADRYFAAVVDGDFEVLAALYADDFRIWHNADDHESTGHENLAAFRATRGFIHDLRYEEVRRTFVPGVVFEQHVVRGHDGNGTEIHCPAILKVHVAGGQITRIEEYFDASHLPFPKELIARG